MANTVFELQCKYFNNVSDGSGIWQYEGGNVLKKGKQVGYYASTKRTVTDGTMALNTAMLTLTIFLNERNNSAPENITMQGSHDFDTGSEIGSVSAASANNAALRGQSFVRIWNNINNSTVTIS